MNELNPRDEALSRALAEVEKTRAVMQTVLDNMSAAVCLYDKDHVLRFLNDMFAVMHDFAPGGLRVGMTIEDVLRLFRRHHRMACAFQHVSRHGATVKTEHDSAS